MLSFDGSIDYLSQLFKALGDPTRLKILLRLAEHEMSVNDLALQLDLTQSAISHQLRLLKNLRLVNFRRDGTTLYYHLDDAHVLDLIQQAVEHSHHH